MRISLDDNFKWKYIERPICRVKEALSNFYYKHRKKIYTCRICGIKEAPFLDKEFNSLPNEHGWHQFKDGFWACHHCVNHYGDKNYECEWDKHVKEHNKELKKRLAKFYKTGKRE